MPHPEPSYPTPGPAESSQGRTVLREDLEAALRFAEDLQNSAAHMALFRWTGIIVAFLSFIVFALLLPSVITSFRLGPALIGVVGGVCAASGSMMVTMYFQRRLRTELRALYRTSQLLHEVAGSQQSSMSPIQRELLKLRLSRLDYGPLRRDYAFR